jgi:hypothetical protein
VASLAEIRACHASVRDAVLAAATSGKLLLVGSGLMPQTIVSGVRAVGGEVAALIEYDARFLGARGDGPAGAPTCGNRAPRSGRPTWTCRVFMPLWLLN